MGSPRIAQVAWCVIPVFVLSFLTNALSQKENTPLLPSEVGWKSIFLGLVAVAIHAMSVPSSVDVGLNRNTPPLLFLFRSSPFICLADALEIIICLFVIVYVKGNTLTRAISAARPAVINQQLNHKQSLMMFFWFLGTITQLVKIYGFQGSQLWWIKAAAGMYIGSWLLIVFVSLFFRDDAYTDDEKRADRTDLAPFLGGPGISYLIISALTLHIGFLAFAMYEVIHIDDLFGMLSEWPEAHFLRFLIRGLLCSLVIIPSAMAFLGLLICYQALFGFLLGSNEETVILRVKAWRMIVVIFMASLLGLLSRHFWTVFLWIFNVMDVAVQGGGMVILGLVVFILLEWAIRWWLVRLGILRGWDLVISVDSMLFCYFGIINLVVGCLYCAYAYNPKGTLKPSWTEKLD